MKKRKGRRRGSQRAYIGEKAGIKESEALGRRQAERARVPFSLTATRARLTACSERRYIGQMPKLYLRSPDQEIDCADIGISAPSAKLI